MRTSGATTAGGCAIRSPCLQRGLSRLGARRAGLVGIGRKGVLARARTRPSGLSRFQWTAVGLLALWVVLMVAGVLYIGTIQFTQSRVAFPGTVAFAVLTMLGFGQVVPPRVRPALAPTLFVLLMALRDHGRAVSDPLLLRRVRRDGIDTMNSGRLVSLAVSVLGVALLVVAGTVWRVDVRHRRRLRIQQDDRLQPVIAVRGGYISPNYDDFDRLDLDLRAYSPRAVYDLTIHSAGSPAPPTYGRSISTCRRRKSRVKSRRLRIHSSRRDSRRLPIPRATDLLRLGGAGDSESRRRDRALEYQELLSYFGLAGCFGIRE